jgi:hypothetical protein
MHLKLPFTTALTIAATALLPAGVRLEGAMPSIPPSHVVIVIEENHNFAEIIGSSAAPYINSLASTGALMTQAFAVAHPSEPNYLALFSGSTQGITDDSCPNNFSGPNLGEALLAAGKTFTGYSESMPSAGYTGCDTGTYARKHNPWVMFSNVPAASNQTFAAFPSGNFANLPLVSIVVPNLDDDMHDGTIQEGDAWLQAHLTSYLQWASANNSLLIVTFDEDDSGDNQIPTFFCGPMVQPGSYPDVINHYNVLRTVEDFYGLPPSGAAAQAVPITDIWKGAPATYAITASAGTGGAIAPSGLVTVAQGGNQTFSITPSAGFTIAGVTVDGAAKGAIATYTFSNVTANHTIAASFSQTPPATFTITATAGAGGAIAPSGLVKVAQGGNQAFSITPSAGFTIAGVTVDGAAKGAIATYTFSNVTGNHTIAASFSQTPPATFTITATAGTGGTIAPTGEVQVAKGLDTTFTIKARHRYRIRRVRVDGVSVGAVDSYTFHNVQSPHTITARFERRED